MTPDRRGYQEDAGRALGKIPNRVDHAGCRRRYRPSASPLSPCTLCTGVASGRWADGSDDLPNNLGRLRGGMTGKGLPRSPRTRGRRDGSAKERSQCEIPPPELEHRRLGNDVLVPWISTCLRRCARLGAACNAHQIAGDGVPGGLAEAIQRQKGSRERARLDAFDAFGTPIHVGQAEPERELVKG